MDLYIYLLRLEDEESQAPDYTLGPQSITSAVLHYDRSLPISMGVYRNLASYRHLC